MYFFDKEFKKDEYIVYGLVKIYGIGYQASKRVCSSLGISEKAKFKDVDNIIIRNLMHKCIKNYTLTVDLRRDIYQNIKNNMEMRNYKGIRYNLGLPLRGQRTKTNAKTVKKLLKRVN